KDLPKKVYIRTFGCQMNVRDSEVICGLLKANNYKLTANPGQADVVIFNTCSVRQHAEDKVWSEIGRIAKLSPYDLAPKARQIKTGGTPRPTKKIVGLVGCMAQNYKEKIFEKAPNVDFVVGPSDIAKIPEIIRKLLVGKRGLFSLEQAPRRIGSAGAPLSAGDSPRSFSSLFTRKIWETDGETRPEEIYHSGFYEDKKHAYVVISEGCSNFCSYCVVPYVRGPLRHRHYKDILKEIKAGLEAGIASFTLLGQNVNAYNCEGVNFIRLVESVNSVKGLEELSFITSHPKDTSIDLFKAIASLEKVKKSLHLPVQSGSDRILKLMNRGYTRKFYLDLIDNYRKIVKGGALTTDIIVGFPTESESDFEDTCRLVKDVGFNSAYIFKYSVRPGTEAIKMPDDVALVEKEKRHKAVLDLQRQISSIKNAHGISQYFKKTNYFFGGAYCNRKDRSCRLSR
ncbi:MAG: hypothetical protein COT38_02475, partial [Candidatus Omnitrophica bacterium CG08_land_8_20_14_0_20_41_16]